MHEEGDDAGEEGGKEDDAEDDGTGNPEVAGFCGMGRGVGGVEEGVRLGHKSPIGRHARIRGETMPVPCEWLPLTGMDLAGNRSLEHVSLRLARS